MNKFFKVNINRSWIPVFLFLGVYLVFIVPLMIFADPDLIPANLSIFLVRISSAVNFLSIIGMLIIGLDQLIDRLWIKGVIVLCLIPALLISFDVISLSVGFLNIGSHTGQLNVGKSINIPEVLNVESVAIGNPWGEQKGNEEDIAVPIPQDDLDAPKEALNSSTPVFALRNPVIQNIPFPELSGDKRRILLRHLAASCRWRVSGAWNGPLFATRRFIVNGQWQGDDIGGDVHGKAFFVFPDGIASSAKGNVRGYKTYAQAGTEPFTLNLRNVGSISSPSYVSELSLSSGKSVIEIHDIDGQYTQDLLYSFRDEVDAVLNSETAKIKGHDASLMPDFSVRTGAPELKVFKTPGYSLSPGDYTVNAFVNPGEEGFVYLKTFDAATNTPLEVKRDSSEYMGWSDDPDEKFFYSYALKIYEGQSGAAYPVRFELWFKADDTQRPERKLIERVYNITGLEY